MDLRAGRAGVMRNLVGERGERCKGGGRRGVQKVAVVLQKRSLTVQAERERRLCADLHMHACSLQSARVRLRFGALRVPASMQTHLCWCAISKKKLSTYSMFDLGFYQPPEVIYCLNVMSC